MTVKTSNFTLWHKLKQKNSTFIAVLHFTITVGSSAMSTSVKRPLVFSNEHKCETAPSLQLSGTLYFCQQTLYLSFFVIFLLLGFPDTKLSTRKQNAGVVILQIPVISPLLIFRYLLVDQLWPLGIWTDQRFKL
jgi:hypothetical protein